MEIQIKKASVEDAEELLEIYRYYVEETAVSFEYVVPTPEEFSNRIETISKSRPYLVAVDANQKIVGYAYASAFHARKAYEWSAETTVYLAKGMRRSGVGRALYEALEESCRRMGILNLNACIAVPKGEDPYLTMDSVQFHEHMGYRMVGRFHESGYKFDRWYDMVWMEKQIRCHTSGQTQVNIGNWSI